MAYGEDLDIEGLLKSFDAPVTAFDCGQLCSPMNEGLPICCESDGVIPVLYHKEYTILNERSKLWQAFKPSCSIEQAMADELPDYQLAVCSHNCSSERENRSLNCRSFPFLPYFDFDGEIVGLVFDLDSAQGKCPLVDLPQTITKDYIRQAIYFWQEVAKAEDEERVFYQEESARTRTYFADRGEPVPVLVEEGIVDYPTNSKEWEAIVNGSKALSLTVLQRPSSIV